MKNYIIICLSLLSMSIFSQNQKTLEGYYNLSEHEMPAHLFILNDNSFHYSAIFGSVDLEIYGTYAIQENELSLYPQEDQMQPFILYARKNKALKDSIAFNYYKPEEDYRYQVVFGVNKQWVKSPLEQKKRNEVYFKVKKKQPKSLKIGYPALHNEASNSLQVKETYTAKIPKRNNDFLLSYNRFYNMRKQFIKNPIQLKGDSIISGDKAKQKVTLAEGEREKIISFLKKNEMFESEIVSREHLFKRIQLRSSTDKPRLQIKENGQLEEIPIDTKQNDETRGEKSSYNSEEIKEVGNYNEKGEKTGEWKTYFKNGALALIANFKNGKLDGELKGIVNYANDEFLEWKEFYKNGQLEKLTTSLSGKRQQWNYYFIDGTLKEEVTRNEEGDSDGVYKTYYQNGKLSRLATFKDGELIGDWKNYDEDGKLVIPEK